MTPRSDVAVIGGGLIGCSIAIAAADRGANVVLISSRVAGAASAAAAGLLAPSLERFAPAAHDFVVGARAQFPAFVQDLESRTGIDIAFARSGILDIAQTEAQAAAVRLRLPDTAVWLDDRDVRRLEPALAPTLGGVLWEEDGYVDNVALTAALERLAITHPGIARLEEGVEAVAASSHQVRVRTGSGTEIAAGHAVLAAGAWSRGIAGAPLAAAVEPVRGQLVAFEHAGVSRPVHCCDSYLVPRAGQTIAGSTMERVGYDPGTTPDVIDALSRAAAVLCPSLRRAPVTRAWAGLRPVTPDLLPLIGPDPEQPRLVYACGHSRNGVLMAPATATAVCEVIFEDNLTFDLNQFRPDRFHGTLPGP